MKIMLYASVLVALLAFGCGDEEITDGMAAEEEVSLPEEAETEESEEVEVALPEPGIPQPFRGLIDDLKKGVEKEDVELCLQVLWEDEYFYHSDMATDDPADDVVFESIQNEGHSLEHLFAAMDSFDVTFETVEFVKISPVEAELRNHYQLLAAVKEGTSLPGGHQGIFAEGDNIFTFKKRGDKWRISQWRHEEMSVEEIHRAFAERDVQPPDALIQNGGIMKLGFP